MAPRRSASLSHSAATRSTGLLMSGSIVVLGLVFGLVVAPCAAGAPVPPVRTFWVGPGMGALADPPPSPGVDVDDSMSAVWLALVITLSTMVSVMLLVLLVVLLIRRSGGIALSEERVPTDILRGEMDAAARRAEAGRERAYVASLTPAERAGYGRGQAWAMTHPLGSVPTEITPSQLLTIQEKGVQAWSFEPDYESNPPVYVQGRTEITFLDDGHGLATEEGGAVSVQSNLPLPRTNEVYYLEVKMFHKPDTTNVAIGLATKPYPPFRFPGLLKYSIGYFSMDGTKCHNAPWNEQPYSVPYQQGDTIGMGYRPRLGRVFFTRNGKRLHEAFIGLTHHDFFPTLAADGPAEVHVNLGQAGFVFIEANVKKWGLAPMVGNLPPPPAYGAEGSSVLIQSSDDRGSGAAGAAPGVLPRSADALAPPPPISPLLGAAEALRAPLPRSMSPHLLPPPQGGGPGARTDGEAEADEGGRSLASPLGSPMLSPRSSGVDISLHTLAPVRGHGMTSHTTTRAAPRRASPPPYAPFAPAAAEARGVWGALQRWLRPSAGGALRLPTAAAEALSTPAPSLVVPGPGG